MDELTDAEEIITLNKVRDFVRDANLNVENIKYADPVFYAWLCLLDQQFSFSAIRDGEKGRLCQLTLWLKNLPANVRPCVETFKALNVPDGKEGKWGVHSQYFLPLFPINNDTYQKLFERPFDIELVKKGISYQNFEKKYVNRLKKKEKYDSRATIITKAIVECITKDPESKFSKNDQLALVYFIESLSNIMLARKLIDELVGNSSWKERPISLGNMDKKNQEKYEKEGWKLLENFLFSRPTFFIFLFSIYVRNFINFYSEKETKNQYDSTYYIDSLSEALEYCNSLTKGIREIAKNIIQHVACHKKDKKTISGFIATRVFIDKIDTDNNENDNSLKFSNFMQDINEFLGSKIFNPNRKNRKGAFLIYIIDDGEEGILETSEKNLQKIKEVLPEKQKDVIEEHIKKLKNGEFRLKDFFYYKNTELMHSQLRSSAGMGLPIFFHLLLENSKGFAIVSTPHKKFKKKNTPNEEDGNGFSSILMYHDSWASNDKDKVIFKNLANPLFGKGTSYLIALPVPKKKKSRAFEVKKSEPDQDKPIKNGIYFEEGFRRYLLNGLKPIKLTKENISFFSKKEVGLWEKIKKEWEEISKKKNGTKEHFIWVDIDDDQISITDVINITSVVEVITGTSGMVVTGVSETTIKELIQLLYAYETNNLSVWDPKHFLLFFPSSSEKGSTCAFNAPVGIIGDKFEDIINFNEQINYHNECWISWIKGLVNENK